MMYSTRVMYTRKEYIFSFFGRVLILRMVWRSTCQNIKVVSEHPFGTLAAIELKPKPEFIVAKRQDFSIPDKMRWILYRSTPL